MKTAVILILLTTATVKQKDACMKSRSRPESAYPLMNVESNNADQPSGVEDATLIPGQRPKPYDIQETEHRWFKDHEILVPTKTAKLTPRTSFDQQILALRKNVHKLPDYDKQCVEVLTYEQLYFKETKEHLLLNNTWDTFFANISNCHMYQENSDVIIQNLLNDMSAQNITRVEKFSGGTQIKLKLTFQNGKQALFKPLRFGLNYESDPNGYYFRQLERANAEIAAFHLDKLLGFRRAVPTIGREFSMSAEFEKHTLSETKALSYYYSPANNLCFIGKCDQYCDTAHPICATEDTIRGSVQAWLPARLSIKYQESPYSRSNDRKYDAVWQGTNRDYCKVVKKKTASFQKGRKLLDLVDISIFDFLTGNQDRHGYDWFSAFDIDGQRNPVTFMIHMDSGRGFGDPRFDDLDILAPLVQCCLVRPSTVKTLLDFYEKDSLGKQLETAMNKDPLRPVLAEKYLVAVDRRVEMILQQVVKCVKVKNAKNVFVNNFRGKSRAAARQLLTINSGSMEAATQGTYPSIQSTRKTIHSAAAQLRKLEHVAFRHGPTTDDLQRPSVNFTLVDFLKSKLRASSAMDTPCHNEHLLQIEKSMDKRENKWPEFYAEISNCYLYKKDSKIVDKLFKEIPLMKIKQVQQVESTQFKAMLIFLDEKSATFKPMRFGREYETNPNHFYFDDFERHHAEIAAFHLDRLLGFRRVPPTVGRQLNILEDLIDKSKGSLGYFRSQVRNDCFHEQDADGLHKGCKYCDPDHAFCGTPDKIQGSVRIQLPASFTKLMDSPYKKIFSSNDYTISSNQTDPSYCDVLKQESPYNNGRRLPDLVNLYIFDFLTGNEDRDQLTVFNFQDEDSEGYLVNTENGKAFGNPKISDDFKILAPLTQCCIVRPSTVKTLLNFYEGDVSLGKQLENSLQQDPLVPILAKKYLVAVNYRLEIILQQVAKCFTKAEETGNVIEVFMNSFHYVPD